MFIIPGQQDMHQNSKGNGRKMSQKALKPRQNSSDKILGKPSVDNFSVFFTPQM